MEIKIPKYESEMLSKGYKTIRYHYTKDGYCPECGEYFNSDELLPFVCSKCGTSLTYYISKFVKEG